MQILKPMLTQLWEDFKFQQSFIIELALMKFGSFM